MCNRSLSILQVIECVHVYTCLKSFSLSVADLPRPAVANGLAAYTWVMITLHVTYNVGPSATARKILFKCTQRNNSNLELLYNMHTCSRSIRNKISITCIHHCFCRGSCQTMLYCTVTIYVYTTLTSSGLLPRNTNSSSMPLACKLL